MPIDPAQARAFAAIDGNRSINEILQMAADANGKEPARRLFERLWQYDQIVFDATGSFPGQVFTRAADGGLL